MDTLTHGLAGALLARAWPAPGDETVARALRRREIATGFFAAMFPDADALLSPFSPDFYITQHRGLNHSFVMLPVWAVLLAAVALRVPRPLSAPRRLAFGRLVAISGVALLSHILLDWITSWGTMFLAPLSRRRWALDWVFIVDLVLSGILFLGLVGTFLLSQRGDRRARIGARASLVAAGVYVAFCGIRHAEALAVVGKILPGESVSSAAIPQPLSPDRWLLLKDDGRAVRAAFIHLGRRGPDPSPRVSEKELERPVRSSGGLIRLVARLPGLYRSSDDPQLFVFPKANGPWARRTLGDGEAGVFGQFARFPTARETREADGTVSVTLRDLRFGAFSGRADPFAYVVRYAPGGRVIFAGFPSTRWASPGGTAAGVGAAQ